MTVIVKRPTVTTVFIGPAPAGGSHHAEVTGEGVRLFWRPEGEPAREVRWLGPRTPEFKRMALERWAPQA